MKPQLLNWVSRIVQLRKYVERQATPSCLWNTAKSRHKPRLHTPIFMSILNYSLSRPQIIIQVRLLFAMTLANPHRIKVPFPHVNYFARLWHHFAFNIGPSNNYTQYIINGKIIIDSFEIWYLEKIMYIGKL
jgi:hypothetical protein